MEERKTPTFAEESRSFLWKCWRWFAEI